MKYNLIFGGIEQTALDYEEETEAVLKEFIKTELEIPDRPFTKIWSYTNDARIPRLWSSFIFG
jgi:hypothetical protein